MENSGRSRGFGKYMTIGYLDSGRFIRELHRPDRVHVGIHVYVGVGYKGRCHIHGLRDSKCHVMLTQRFDGRPRYNLRSRTPLKLRLVPDDFRSRVLSSNEVSWWNQILDDAKTR